MSNKCYTIFVSYRKNEWFSVDSCFLLTQVFLLTSHLFHLNCWAGCVSYSDLFSSVPPFGDTLASFVRTCQKTVDSSCWWGHVSTSSRPTKMSSPLRRVISSACLVRRTAAGGRGPSMAGPGGFLATTSVKSKAPVGTSTFSLYKSWSCDASSTLGLIRWLCRWYNSLFSCLIGPNDWQR